MNKGDTLDITLNYQVNGEDITEDMFDEVELQLEFEKNSNQIKLLKSEGGITWDDSIKKYVTHLTQSDTFKFSQVGKVRYQLRVLEEGNVYSSEIGSFEIGDVLSRKILE